MEFVENVASAHNVAAKPVATPSKKTATSGVSKIQTPRTVSAKSSTVVATTPRGANGLSRSVQSASKLNSSGRVPFSPVASTGSQASFPTREAARIAKEQSTIDRIQRVAMMKEKWAKERELKAKLHSERKAMSMQKLNEDCEQAAEARKRNLLKKQEFEEKEKQKTKDQLFTSLKERTLLAQDLAAEAKAKRRISVFLNNQMRKRAQQKLTEIEAEKKQQQVDLLASRRLDFLEVREAKKAEEQRKRESLMNRTLLAQDEKKRLEETEQKKREEERSILQMRQQNFQDDVAAKEAEDRRRRESVAFRLDEWRMHKSIDEALFKAEEQREHDLFKSKEEDWRSKKAFEEEQEKRKRESLAGRLNEWREQKSAAEHERGQQQLAEEMEHDLQRQAEEDVKHYRENQKQTRRQSLAYRLDKARKDRDFDQGQKALQRVVQEEERRIAELDRQDVDDYRQKILDARRQSLEYRNQTEYQERMRKDGEKQAQRLAFEADRELREEAWRDVQCYREQQRAEARKSLAWRLADYHRQHELELAMHQEKLEKMHMDFALRHEDWLSLQEYKKQEAERRRKSIALRLDSWKQQRLAEEKEQAKRELIKEEEAILREQDREELLATKLANDMIERKNMVGSDFMVIS